MLQKQCSTRNSLKVAQKFFFSSKGGDKLLQRVTTSYNAFQEVTKNRHAHYFQCCSRNLFSEGRGKAATTRYSKLQCVARDYKDTAAKDQFESCPKVLFSLKEVISCYNVLQRVTVHYKRLQKIGMCTTFNVAQGIYFLKEGEKLL